MAMGDALAVALLKKRDFGREEFAFLHPGGTLGKKLLRISELMFTGEHIPAVRPGATLREVIFEITRKRFGCTCVVDEAGKLAGLITDGDLRRTMQDREDLRSLRAGDFMNPAPKTISPASRASQALEVMKQYNILQIVVVDETRHPVGMLHLHDLLEAGIGS